MQSTVTPTYSLSTQGQIREYIKAALVDPSQTTVLPVNEIGDAQLVLDEIWKILDSPALPRNSRDILRRLILKLAIDHNRFPAALVLQNVTLTNSERHGEGAYGEVYRGTFGGAKVALKVPRMYIMMRPEQKETLRRALFRESLIWRHLVHDHVLPFLGVTQNTFHGRFSMVVPWMDNGSLPLYIYTQRANGTLSDHNFAQNVHHWIHQIALGLAYLHGEGIVHGDLHPGNLLVDERGFIRISDFGLSLLSDGTPYNYGSVHGGGAVYYTAPELFDPEAFGLTTTRPSFHSDMYAFGCVCYELFSGSVPFSGLTSHQVSSRVVRGDRPPRPSLPGDNIWSLMQHCWSMPEERLSADAVATRLADVISTHFNRYLDPQVQYYLSHLQATIEALKQNKDLEKRYREWLERSLSRCVDYYNSDPSTTISWILSGYSPTGSPIGDVMVSPPHTALFYSDDSRAHVISRYFKAFIKFPETLPVTNDYYRQVMLHSRQYRNELLVAPPGSLKWVPGPNREFILDSLGARPVDYSETPIRFNAKFEHKMMPWITRRRHDQIRPVAVSCLKYNGCMESSLFSGGFYDRTLDGRYVDFKGVSEFDILCYND